MAKVGKLTKLKSAIRRWPSFTKHNNSAAVGANATVMTATSPDDKVSKDLHAVYVGKARRRYLLSSDVICHPLFQELIDRSGGLAGDGEGDEGEAMVVACEVVLFEHFLWMLENSGADQQLGSMEELVEFYTY